MSKFGGDSAFTSFFPPVFFYAKVIINYQKVDIKSF